MRDKGVIEICPCGESHGDDPNRATAHRRAFGFNASPRRAPRSNPATIEEVKEQRAMDGEAGMTETKRRPDDARLDWKVVSIALILCGILPAIFVPLFLIRAIRGKQTWANLLPGLTLGTTWIVLWLIYRLPVILGGYA